MAEKLARRDFIQGLGLGALGLALLPRVAMARGRGLRLAGEPKSIVILGGGLAGLAAGYELKRAGHKVTILEARKQPGGRVRTIRDFADGQYAEAGPISFPQEHEFTFGYAVDFKLPLRTPFTIGLDAIAHIRGSRFRVGANGAANVPFSLKASERERGVFGIIPLYLESYMRKVGNPRRSDWPPDELREIDSISLTALLQQLGASDGAIDIIAASQLGLLGFGLDSISAMDGVVTETIASYPVFYEIEGGMDQLSKALKKKVKKQFKKQSIVRRIEQDDTSVTVTYEDKAGIQTITADRCICTLPFPVLRDIEVTPQFSDEKLRAVHEMKLTPVTRTFMQFRSRVWEQDRLSGYGITDLPIQNTYSPTAVQAGRRGILVSYAGGQRALDLSAMSERDRQDFVLRRMGNLFNNLNNQFESGLSHIWHEEEWARGAFAYFEPGQMATLLPLAQRPEGRIHFAGEHTSAWHGWMNGALESGNRAAEEINDAEAAQVITVGSRLHE
jgi:monoamine oxidase